MSEWRTAKVREELFTDIENAIEHIKTRNLRKYNSVASFVEEACVLLLEKEKAKLEVPV